MEDIFSIIRYIHILSAVFWGGAIFVLNFFLFPAIKASGPDGGKFMQQFSKANSFPQVMTIVGAITIITGIIVLWHFSANFNSAFMGSKAGILLSLGGLSGLAAYLHGIFINRPTIQKISNIGEEISKSGAPPSPEQAKQIEKLRNRIFTTTKWMTLFIILGVTLMSLARYI